MKPKYLFYIILMVMIHYEVGRLINADEEQDEVSESNYEKSVKLDSDKNDKDAFRYGVVHKVRLIKRQENHAHRFNVWK
ncbi:hypothetical protein [Mucilaginibacter agri]|uniref:Uncharacterized protein n=1 Tax=Mucilaginibacter agri TaxID=2695265 RepID=A0A966DSU3_9SPHI|nr:hypothetical protein [Mucilaginibacter agri]NCD68109.1 hypothetical protein [Mucilaginibacter agri]